MKKQVVFTSADKETKAGDTFGVVKPIDKSFVQFVEKKEGYFFTPEQLNELLSNVIKDTLETAYDEAKVVKDLGEDEDGKLTFEVTECYYDENGYPIYVEKESISSTFDITFKKHNV